MTSGLSEKLFEYDNYRFFLRDYFQEQKRQQAVFSHRYFARRAGFSSSSFCAHLIDGKRNLTANSLRKLLKGLGLSGRTAGYFENLVYFNQARTVEDREHYFRALERLRKSTQLYRVNQRQFAYYDEWYYPVVRELAVYSDWVGDYAKLGRLIRPAISADKARQAVDLLVDIGLLRRRADGSCEQSAESLTAESVPGSVTRKVRKEYLLRALEAVEGLPLEQRHIAGVTAAMSQKTYRESMAKLDEIRRSILDAAADDDAVEGVYQFNFQAFPVSQTFAPKKGPAPGGSR
jgi:uncharacterized protein (TIGR02147 family)